MASSRTPSPPEQAYMSAPAQHNPGPATFTRAPKGKACLNCRRRKLKCDCAHPVCNQCVRFGRERDCEYSEKDQRSRTEILEETISNLQARVRELESGSGPASGRRAAPPAPGPSSALVQGTDWTGLGDDLDFRELVISTQLTAQGSRNSSPHSSSSIAADPTPSEARSLIDVFLLHSLEIGFFLYIPRFLAWAFQQIPNLSSPFYDPSFSQAIEDPDPLLSVVYLWGAVLGTDEVQRRRQHSYLVRALQDVHSAEQRSLSARFGGAELLPDVVRLVQCHVLLAHYFFTDGQFREGRQHTADAVSLILLHQLHKIRSPRGRDASKTHLVGVGVAHTAMHPPADLIEEGERTHAFWHVYILDKIWASLLGCPSLLVEDGSPATEIDTPWPLALDQYADGTLPPGYGSTGSTVTNFVSTHDVQQTAILSPVALRAKAAALMYRASWFSSSSSSDPGLRELHANSFDMTDDLLDKFFVSLPQIETAKEQLAPTVLRHIVVTQCLTRVALYQLHYPFVDDDLKSAAKGMSASKTVIANVAALPADLLADADPLLAVLLTMPFDVITCEIVKIAASHVTTFNRPLMGCVSPYYLVAHMDEAAQLISRISPRSRLTALQQETVTSIRSALVGTEYASASNAIMDVFPQGNMTS